MLQNEICKMVYINLLTKSDVAKFFIYLLNLG